MRRSLLFGCFTAVLGAGLLPPAILAQPASTLGGIWTLSRSQSEFRSDLGFTVNWMPAPGADGQPAGGGRGRRGSGGGGGESAEPFSGRRESYDDARRVQLLTDEARNPPARLTVVDTPAAVTMTNELGQSRTFHPDAREETIDIQGVPVGVTAKRDGDQLVVRYHVGQERELRCTWSRAGAQLAVDLQFVERGAGDKARRVYDAGTTPITPSAQNTPTNPATPGTPSFDQRPGAELRGLKSLGVLVEDLGAPAIACGLSHDAIESALSKRLSDGGFTVRRNADDDTYVYVNIITARQPDGTCVSRYDAFLYSHATASLSYRDRPVLVQVSLMHRGGIGSSAAPSHPAAVTRGLQDYADVFIAQIRDANK